MAERPHRGIFMRLRAIAASAVLVLCATTGAAACSSSSDAADTADTTRPAGPAASTESASDGGGDPAECATSAAEIPEECALDLSFSESTDAEPTAGSPATP
jgi:hypothetical protein